MSDVLFGGVFDTALTTVIAPADFLLCVLVSLGVGVLLCATTLWRARSSGSFAVALALLPAVVCVVIMLVNGNLGTAVAVAGAFSLVRFRSAPGSAREICALFIAMGAGLVAGMGYLGYAVLFSLVMGLACMALTAVRWGADGRGRTLHITVPEDLDYEGVFEPVLARYTTDCCLRQVKPTGMGSLFRLTYDVTLRGRGMEKQLIDELRLHNGNLEISLGHRGTEAEGL